MLTAIQAGLLFDGTGTAPVRDAVVLVEGDRITGCGTGAEVAIPSDATVINCRNEFVMPGLINAHTHITIIPALGNQSGQLRQPATTQLLRGVGNLRRGLRSGVTTSRIMGEERFLDVEIRDSVRQGLIPGPDLVISCRPITASNGHGRAISSFDGVEEIRKGARENLAAGADFLKLFLTGGVSSEHGGVQRATYTPAEIRAATEEAERAGTYVAAHALGGPGIRMALENGVRTLEHATMASDHDLDLMARQGAWAVLTLSILLHPTGIEEGEAGRPRIMAKLHQARKEAAGNFRRIIASGVNYAVGTDSIHGEMPFEMECLVRFGASNRDALLAATARGAEVCQREDEVGTIGVGKRADIISLRGNPLEDMAAMRSTNLIMKGGIRFDPLSKV